MKFKNLTEKDFVLAGVFRDSTRSVKVPASGEVSFPDNRIVPNINEKLSFLSEYIVTENSKVADMEDDAFEKATLSTELKFEAGSEGTPWVAFTKDGITGGKMPEVERLRLSDFDKNSQGIEDVVAFQLDHSYLTPHYN